MTAITVGILSDTHGFLDPRIAECKLARDGVEDAVVGYLNRLMEPVRQTFNSPELKKLTAQAYPPISKSEYVAVNFYSHKWSWVQLYESFVNPFDCHFNMLIVNIYSIKRSCLIQRRKNWATLEVKIDKPYLTFRSLSDISQLLV